MGSSRTSGWRVPGRLLGVLLVCSALTADGLVQAMPEDGTVVDGTAAIRLATPQRLDILQASPTAIIDWRAFSLDVDEQAHFQQPSASSITLNRVRGGASSRLLGQLTANGQVMLINPNGILFGHTAVVDVGGLVATTLDIRDEDFRAGRFTFNLTRHPGGTVVNRGRITVAEGGLAALVAPGVANRSVIQARLGRVALASGHAFTLDLHGDSLIRLRVADRVVERLTAPDGAPLTALVTHSGTISAAGGTVLLAAGAAKDVVDHVINLDGIVEARSAEMRHGQIHLLGTGEGSIRVAGTLDASGPGPGDTGGRVTVLGAQIGVGGHARLDVSGAAGGGEMLIGGNVRGQGPERPAAFTAIGRDVVLQADALTAGAGGRVIVWSDQATRFFGTLSARGGRVSGDGGFAEVSGRQRLQFAPASIDLAAPNGAMGALLLDPQDITIADTGTDDTQVSGDNEILFGDGTATTDYTIAPSAFEAINADITLQATRDITVSDPIDRSGAADSTLTLQAGRHLTISANVTGTNGAHRFIFEADSPRSTTGGGDGTGTLTISDGVTITSNNGAITLIGAGFVIDTTTGAGANLNAGTGDIHIAPSQSTAALTIDATAANLSSAEIARLATTGTIVLGTATTGPTATGGAGSAISAKEIVISEAMTAGGGAALTFASGGKTKLRANVTTAGGAVVFDDPVELLSGVANREVNSGTGGGNISFTSTVKGGDALLVRAGTGAVTFSGKVGEGITMAALRVTGGAVTLHDARASYMEVTGTAITLSGTYKAQDGDITFTGPVTLAGAVRVDAGTQGRNAFLRGTVDGGHALTVIGQQVAEFTGAVGGTTPLASLTVTLTSTREVSNTVKRRIRLGGNVTATGAIDFNSEVLLTADVTVSTDAGNGSITFDRKVEGPHALTAAASSVTFSGSVKLTGTGKALTVTGPSVTLSNTVSTSGAIAIDGGEFTLTGASLTTAGGNIDFKGLVSLERPNATDSITVTSGSAGGNIRFHEAVDGGNRLTVTAGTGSVTFSGAVGSDPRLKLTSLTVSGGQVDLAAVVTTGAISITGTNIDLNAATYSSDDGTITFTGPVDLTLGTTVDSDANDDSTDGTIRFTSTVDGAFALTVDADTGSVTFGGAAGGTTRLTSLTVAGGQLDVNTVAATGAIDLEGTNIDLNGATYSSNDGDITFTGPVDLHADVTVNSDANDDSTDGDITFTSTIDGGYALHLDADSGAITVAGAMGATTDLTSLTVAGGAVSLKIVNTVGAIAVTGSGITLDGSYRSDDGHITFTGPVTLAGAVTVDSDANTDGTDGAITFRSTVNGAYALTLDADAGAVALSGAVGGATKLASLTVSGGQIDLAAVATTGAIDIEITQGSSRYINLRGATYSSDDGNITFTGLLAFHTGVTVDSDADNDSTDGNIAFTSTVDGAHALTLDADTGAVTMTDTIGRFTALTNLTVTGNAVSLAGVGASGAISVTGAASITLNGVYNSNDGDITFTGPVTLAGAVTVNSDRDDDGTDGDITFTSTVNGTHSLTADADTGSVTFSGDAGLVHSLSRLTVKGGAVSLRTTWTAGATSVTGSSITLNGIYGANGDITFTGPVTLASSATVNSNADDGTLPVGDIVFTSTVNGPHELTVTADSARSVTGSVEFRGAVTLGGTGKALIVDGGQIDLAAVSASGRILVTGTNIDLNGASYTSTGANITFTGPVDLHAAVTVDSGSGAGNIEFTSTVNGRHALTVTAGTGSVTFGGAAGLGARLSRLTVTGGAVSLKAVKTAGAMSVTGSSITLNAGNYGSRDGAITFTGAVTLAGAVSVNSDESNNGTDGTITFTSTVNGAHALTVDADRGSVTFTGAAGGTTKLASLTVTGGQIDVNTVATTGAISIRGTNIDLNAARYTSDDGNITFTGPVDLTADTRVDSDADSDDTDGNIIFTSTVDGAYALTADANTGSVTFGGAVGGTTKLTDLTITGGAVTLGAVSLTGTLTLTTSGTTTLAGTITVDDSDITFSGPVVLGAAVTVDSDGDNDGDDGDITFASTVNGAHALTVDADTGSVTFSGAVGGTTALASLTVRGGQIDLNTVATTGAISIRGSNIDLNAGSYTTAGGNIAFIGPVDLHTDVTMSSGTSGGNITFSSTIDGSHALTVTAGTGNVIFDAAVTLGGTGKALTVSGGQIDLNAVSVSGAISVTGTNIDLNAASYTSAGGNIDFRGDVRLANSINSPISIGSGGGNIRFHRTVQGFRFLTVDAGAGSVTFSGAVGGSAGTNLRSLTVTGGAVSLKGVSTSSVITVTGSTSITLNGTYNSDDSTITFTGPVTLAGAVTVDSDSDNDSTDGNIVFTSTVNGAHALTVDAGTGSVTFSGAVGGTTALASLAVRRGRQIDLNTVAATGAVSVTGTNIDLNAASYTSTGGNITFIGPVDLHTSLTVSSGSGGGNIRFDGLVNGTRALTVTAGTGSVTFNSPVGGTTVLASLAVSGGQIALNTVAATGAIDITGTEILLRGTSYSTAAGNIDVKGPVKLSGINHITVGTGSGGGNIQFHGAVDSTTERALTVTAGAGSVTFSGEAGGTSRLLSLTVNGGAISLKGVSTRSGIAVTGSSITLNGTYGILVGGITFTGPVTLAGTVMVDSDRGNTSTDGTVTFTSTVDGAHALTADADTGTVTFAGAVGATTALASLTVRGGQIDLNTVAATGAVAVTGSNIDLNAASYTSDDGNITFTGPVDLAVDTTVDSDADSDDTDGNITFTSTVNGTHALTVTGGTGSVTFSGVVGGTTALSSLTVSGGEVALRASLATTGNIAFTGTGITLRAFHIRSDDGDITFTGPVVLGENAEDINSDADDDDVDGDITFTSTIDANDQGFWRLTVDADTGDVELRGAAGGTGALGLVRIKGGQVDVNSIRNSGRRDIRIEGSNIDLNGTAYNSGSGRITFAGPVDLHADVTVDSDADSANINDTITFTSTVDGAHALTVTADTGSVTFSGAVGGTTKLTSLTVTGGQIDVNTVAAAGAISITGTNIDLNGATYSSDDGNITFTGMVDLHTDVTVDSDADNDGMDGSITFPSAERFAVNGGHALTLDADTGAVTVGSGRLASGVIGGQAALTSLTVKGGAVRLGGAYTTGGAISVTGSGITLYGIYRSAGSAITFTGSVTLIGVPGGNVTVESGTGGGNIAFTSTVDGAYRLTVTAGTGSVTFTGAVGGTTALAGLTVSGGQVDLDAVATTGAISVTGTNIDLNAGSYNSDDGDITFTGPVDLHADTRVDSDADDRTDSNTDDDADDGNIRFTSTIDGGHALTLNAGTGSVTVAGAIGGTAALSGLRISGGQVDVNSVAVSGGADSTILIRGRNIDLNGTEYKTDDGSINFIGAVDLHAGVTVDSDADDDGTDGNIRFITLGSFTVSTVDGAYALTLDAGTGEVELEQAAGGTAKLASLTVTGGQVDLNSVSATGVISITGTNIDLNGLSYRSDDGGITFAGPVDLHSGVTVDSDRDNDGDDGAITFTSTIDGYHSLVIDADTGSVALQGAAGGTAALRHVAITGGRVGVDSISTGAGIGGTITVTGANIDLNGTVYQTQDANIRFEGPVALQTDVTVDSDSNGDRFDGNITFTSTVNGAHALTVRAGTGAVTFGGAVGGTTALTSLTARGGRIGLSGASYTSAGGNITFGGPVALQTGVTVSTGPGGGNVRFTSTVNGGHALTVNAGTGAVTVAGAAGGTAKLGSLTVSGGQVGLKAVSAAGAISVTGTNIGLNARNYRSDDGDITFTGPVALTINVTVDSDADNDGTAGDMTFTSTVDGAYALTADADTGSVTFAGAVGGTTALASLTVDGGQVGLNTVAATGAVSIRGTNIGLNGASYTSTGGRITFTGPVALHTGVTVNSSAGGENIAFTSTVDGAHALTVTAGTGRVRVSGAVGGTTALASLTVSGGQIDLDAVAAAGAVSITGTNIDLNAGSYRSDDGDLTFTGPVDLHTTVTVDSDADTDGTAGDILFTSTIDGIEVGMQSLTLNAGTGAVTVTGAIGGTIALGSLSTNGNPVMLLGGYTVTGAYSVSGDVVLGGGSYTSGTIDYQGEVMLLGDVTITATDSVVFASTVTGSHNLTVNGGDGPVTFSGDIGDGDDPLVNLTVTGGMVSLMNVTATGTVSITGTSINLNGTAYRSDDGPVAFRGPVALHTNVSVNSDADDDGTDGSITFTSTINGAYALTLDADGGTVTLPGAVGGTTPLTSLTVDGGQVDVHTVATTGPIDIAGTNIDLNGATYRSDDGNVIFRGPVDLHTNVTVDSDADDDGTDGSMTFTATINGAYALTLDADGGAVTLSGAVGSTTPLTSLTVDGGQVAVHAVATTGPIDITGTSIDLTGATYRSDDGPVVFRGPVALHTDVTVDSDADDDGTDGSMTFTATIDGAYALTLNADGGAVTLPGAVGSTTPLTSLTVDGGQVDVHAVATTGTIDLEGTSIALTGATYRSDDGPVIFRGPVALHTDVSVDSDADDDGTDGSITFTSTLDGAYALTLDADGANIAFAGDVGATVKLGAMTITKAHDVTVATSMRVGSFTQLAGTGTTDFGLSTLYADTVVDVTTRDIEGRIIANAATLTARHFIGVTVAVDTLTIQATRTDMQGTVNGFGGQAAADSTIILNRGPGSYKMNGFTILGTIPETGRGTRHYAELAALPFSQPTRRWGTPGDVVSLQFSPTLRASVVGAMDRAYPVNVFAWPFALVHPQAGMESFYDQLPGVIRDMWWRLGTDAIRNTHEDQEDHEEESQ